VEVNPHQPAIIIARSFPDCNVESSLPREEDDLKRGIAITIAQRMVRERGQGRKIVEQTKKRSDRFGMSCCTAAKTARSSSVLAETSAATI
jgi:hypothetical protein